MLFRLLRIGAIAALLPLLFTWSQRMAAARGNEPVPGISAAVGVVSLIFLVRAIAAERGGAPQPALQKDVFWGVAAGGLVTILLRAGCGS